jgi:predicted HicB family RNase H-like nuclease
LTWFCAALWFDRPTARTHKGYSARIEYDDEDGVFHGKIAGIHDVVSFHVINVGDLRAAVREAVADYVATCAKIGKPPEKAFSGQMMLRVNPEIHAKAALAAELAGKSLNQWSEEALSAGGEWHESGVVCERAPAPALNRALSAK